MPTRKIELLFSDTEVGCEEFGFIPRVTPAQTSSGFENEDEDRLYRKHLRAKGIPARVVEGTIYLQEAR